MAPWNTQSQGSRENSQHFIAQVVDLGEKDGIGDTHCFPSDHCPQQSGALALGHPGPEERGILPAAGATSAHTACVLSLTI